MVTDFSCHHEGCQQRYTKKQNLRRHIQLHADWFLCSRVGCSYQNSKSNLAKHILLHENPKSARHTSTVKATESSKQHSIESGAADALAKANTADQIIMAELKQRLLLFGYVARGACSGQIPWLKKKLSLLEASTTAAGDNPLVAAKIAAATTSRNFAVNSGNNVGGDTSRQTVLDTPKSAPTRRKRSRRDEREVSIQARKVLKRQRFMSQNAAKQVSVVKQRQPKPKSQQQPQQRLRHSEKEALTPAQVQPQLRLHVFDEATNNGALPPGVHPTEPGLTASSESARASAEPNLSHVTDSDAEKLMKKATTRLLHRVGREPTGDEVVDETVRMFKKRLRKKKNPKSKKKKKRKTAASHEESVEDL
jgi:hypothetical protein